MITYMTKKGFSPSTVQYYFDKFGELRKDEHYREKNGKALVASYTRETQKLAAAPRPKQHSKYSYALHRIAGRRACCDSGQQ